MKYLHAFDCFLSVGIGEYVVDPRFHPDNDPTIIKDMKTPSFSISTNAIVVNIASPDAIADSFFILMSNSTLRHSIGDAGRQTIISYFTIDRQMCQYSSFYKELLSE